jgi:molecular chaperone DnaK (HSP70)
VIRLGIDFGTTRTVIAGVDDGRYPVACFDHDGRYVDYLPGHAAIDDDGRLCFGDAARRRMAAAGSLAVSSVKRAITGLAPDDPVPGLGGAPALDVAAAYLQWVRRMVCERSNLDVPARGDVSAMVAVPANAGTHQRYVTMESFRRAGFDVLGMINEPTAAAIEYGHRNANALSPRSPKRYVLVYDLGGGTFDTAAIHLAGRRFRLLTSRGIPRLGGADFDEHLLQLAAEAKGFDPDAFGPGPRAGLLEICREAKEALRPTSRKLLLDFSPIDEQLGEVILDTAELYRRCQPLVGRTLTMLVRVIESLTERGIDVDDSKQLAALYLVGGASAFPAVARGLRERFSRKLQLAPQAHAATAVGLAVAADPHADVFVREAITRHFGVWREARDGHDKVFDPILAQDTASDDESIVVHREYRPAHAIGHLRFLECSELDDAGQPAGDLRPWSEIRFPYDPALAELSEIDDVPVERRPVDGEIVETYRYTGDGSIAVEIENRTHGYRRSYVLGARR